jgi:hypothetical protein
MPSRDELMRGAVAEARDDLDRRLMPTARAMLRRDKDSDKTAAALTTGLLRQAAWDRTLLASVLGAALVRLAERDLAERRPAEPEGGETP